MSERNGGLHPQNNYNDNSDEAIDACFTLPRTGFGHRRRIHGDRIQQYLSDPNEPDEVLTVIGSTRVKALSRAGTFAPALVQPDLVPQPPVVSSTSGPSEAAASSSSAEPHRKPSSSAATTILSDNRVIPVTERTGNKLYLQPQRRRRVVNVTLEQNKQPILSPPVSSIPCEFYYLGCNERLAIGQDPQDESEGAWWSRFKEHTISHFPGRQPPDRIGCPFCDAEFDIGPSKPSNQLWDKRMEHVKTHWILEPGRRIFLTTKPDILVVRYLVSKSLLSNKAGLDLMKLRTMSVGLDLESEDHVPKLGDMDKEMRSHRHNEFEREKRKTLRRWRTRLMTPHLGSRKQNSPGERYGNGIVEIYQDGRTIIRNMDKAGDTEIAQNVDSRLNLPGSDERVGKYQLYSEEAIGETAAAFSSSALHFPGVQQCGRALVSIRPQEFFEREVGNLVRSFISDFRAVAELRSKSSRTATSCQMIADISGSIAKKLRNDLTTPLKTISTGQDTKVADERQLNDSKTVENGLEAALERLTEVTWLLVPVRIFEGLCERFRELYYDPTKKVTKIGELLDPSHLRMEASEFCTANLQMGIGWDLMKFMEVQYGGEKRPPIASVITISGSALYCQAMTCGDYMEQTWGQLGLKMLEVLQTAVDIPESTSSGSLNGGTIMIDLKCGTFKVVATPNTVQKVAEVVLWLAGSFCVTEAKEVKYARALVSHIGRGDFTVDCHVVPLVKEERLCWLPLFRNALIVKGFPVAHRPACMLGLEIPLPIVAALIGAEHAAGFQYGILMKGFSSMLAPVHRLGDCVEWHFVNNPAGNRIRYNEIGRRCPSRLAISVFDHAAISTTRAFLAWCEGSESYLGSNNICYGDISESSASRPTKEVELTGFSVGFSRIGIGTANFSIGTKEQAFAIATTGRLESILDSADEMSVCLYDLAERRAWLVSGTEVLLYLIHLKNQRRPYMIGDQAVSLEYANPACDGAVACRKAMIKMAALPLISNKSTCVEDYYVRNLVSDLWLRLEIVDANSEVNVGVPVGFGWRQKLRGFEVMHIALPKTRIRRRETILKNTNGGWASLLKASDSIVLFGNHLGELLKPSQFANVRVPRIVSLPSERDFLATSVHRIFRSFGQPDDTGSLKLCGVEIHRSESKLVNCYCLEKAACSCACLFRVTTKSQLFLASLLPIGPLCSTGCIMIGVCRGSLLPSANERHPRSFGRLGRLENMRLPSIAEVERRLPPQMTSDESNVTEIVQVSSDGSSSSSENQISPSTSIGQDEINEQIQAPWRSFTYYNRMSVNLDFPRGASIRDLEERPIVRVAGTRKRGSSNRGQSIRASVAKNRPPQYQNAPHTGNGYQIPKLYLD